MVITETIAEDLWTTQKISTWNQTPFAYANSVEGNLNGSMSVKTVEDLPQLSH